MLAPTRELALQIDESLHRLAANPRLRSVPSLGGVSRFGIPGRVRDRLATAKLRLGAVSNFVLDEPDRMLDLGLLGDTRRIVVALPARRQSALFSATTPKIQAAGVFRAGKRPLLMEQLGDSTLRRVIVFTCTKRGTDHGSEGLERAGQSVSAIHGSQPQPERTLDQFRCGRSLLLVRPISPRAA